MTQTLGKLRTKAKLILMMIFKNNFNTFKTAQTVFSHIFHKICKGLPLDCV